MPRRSRRSIGTYRQSVSTGRLGAVRLEADPVERPRVWCEMLRLVRDEADLAQQDFLVYLLDVAIAHAASLSRIGIHARLRPDRFMSRRREPADLNS